jgi:hypothetical protein
LISRPAQISGKTKDAAQNAPPNATCIESSTQPTLMTTKGLINNPQLDTFPNLGAIPRTKLANIRMYRTYSEIQTESSGVYCYCTYAPCRPIMRGRFSGLSSNSGRLPMGGPMVVAMNPGRWPVAGVMTSCPLLFTPT